MKTNTPLLCPNCSTPVSLNPSQCPGCGYEFNYRHGILSFSGKTPKTCSRDQLTEDISELIGERTMRDATTELLQGRSDSDQILKELYDTRLDAWRVFVSDILDGRCLDLYAGCGRRSLSLAELADTVYAVDPDISKLRILDQRDDFRSADRVVPVHSSVESPIFNENTFDTVVADYTGRSNQLTHPQIEFIDSIVVDRGAVVLLVDGITRKAGLTGLMGLNDSSLSTSVARLRSTVGQCERALEELEYETIKVFALWPISEQLSWVYEIGDSRREYRFVEQVFDRGSPRLPLVSIGKATSKAGILQYLFPNFLIVGCKEEKSITNCNPRSILKTGRSRSIVFTYGNELLSVEKIPNRVRHSEFNEREHELIQKLRVEEPQIRDNLPTGELVDSPFGSIRKEKAVDGKPLSETLDGTVMGAEQALTMGLDWLVDFQQPSKRERIQFSADEYITQSEVDTKALDFSHLQTQVELFVTPIHGDLTPKNIYIEDSDISVVIDWEYGKLKGNPIVDAGFFIAYVLAYNRTSAPGAMIELFEGESHFAEIGRSAAKKYCERVDIAFQTFLDLLPIVYVHQVNIDHEVNATATYTANTSKRLGFSMSMWNQV